MLYHFKIVLSSTTHKPRVLHTKAPSISEALQQLKPILNNSYHIKAITRRSPK